MRDDDEGGEQAADFEIAMHDGRAQAVKIEHAASRIAQHQSAKCDDERRE